MHIHLTNNALFPEIVQTLPFFADFDAFAAPDEAKLENDKTEEPNFNNDASSSPVRGESLNFGVFEEPATPAVADPAISSNTTVVAKDEPKTKIRDLSISVAIDEDYNCEYKNGELARNILTGLVKVQIKEEDDLDNFDIGGGEDKETPKSSFTSLISLSYDDNRGTLPIVPNEKFASISKKV